MQMSSIERSSSTSSRTRRSPGEMSGSSKSPDHHRHAELRRHALVDAVPLVEALHALEHHHRDLERDRDHAAVERLALDEAELAGAPGEHVEDAFLRLEHEQVLELLLGDAARG